MNVKRTFENVGNKVSSIHAEDILAALGLQKRRSTMAKILPIVGAAVGALVVGAAIAFLLPNKTNKEVRKAIQGIVK